MAETGVAIDVINALMRRNAWAGATFIDVSCTVNVRKPSFTNTRVRA